MPSKFTLSQRHKAKETKKLLIGDLASLIENALRNTLNTVKWSSNLTPPILFCAEIDSIDKSILIPESQELSSRWPLFLLNRTLSHTPYGATHLVTTYKKLADNKNWQQVFKNVDRRCCVYFEDKAKQNLFNTLELSLSDFVTHNVQARNERSGNCTTLALTLYYFLWDHAIKSDDNLINRIEFVWFKSLDHCFIMINRNFNSSLSDFTQWNGWIIDPWRGVNGKAFVLHSDDFLSYVASLRHSRADIIYSNSPTSLDVVVRLSIMNIKLPEKITGFKMLDELIHHGKMELVAEQDSTCENDMATHKSRFFTVKKDLESLKPKENTSYHCQML